MPESPVITLQCRYSSPLAAGSPNTSSFADVPQGSAGRGAGEIRRTRLVVDVVSRDATRNLESNRSHTTAEKAAAESGGEA